MVSCESWFLKVKTCASVQVWHIWKFSFIVAFESHFAKKTFRCVMGLKACARPVSCEANVNATGTSCQCSWADVCGWRQLIAEHPMFVENSALQQQLKLMMPQYIHQVRSPHWSVLLICFNTFNTDTLPPALWTPSSKSTLVSSLCNFPFGELWRRPPGRPRTAWMRTIQQDRRSNNLSLDEAITVAQNRLLWRLMSAFGSTRGACHTRRRRRRTIAVPITVATTLIWAMRMRLKKPLNALSWNYFGFPSDNVSSRRNKYTRYVSI